MSFAYAVALTGSIATGKSTVANYCKDHGISVIDADSIAHQILDQEYKAIQQYFGYSIIVDERVDRKALGDIVFKDKTKRKWLEGLLHPLIYNDIETKAQVLDRGKQVYLVDIPLFFESKRYSIDKVLLVYTNKQLQLTRLMHRNGLSKEAALQRIHTQMDIEEKRLYAQYILENHGSISDLYHDCDILKERIIGDFK